MNLVVDINGPILAGWAHEQRPSVSWDPVHGKSSFEPDSEVFSLLNNGVLYNAESIDPLLAHIYEEFDVEESATLTVNQNAWADQKLTTKLAEVAFEKYHVGQLGLLKRQLSTAYALSKPSACLVIDIDQDYVSVVPISNGKVINKGVVKSNFGGDFINLFTNQYLQSHVSNVDLIPLDYVSKMKNESWSQYMVSKTLNQFNRCALTLYGDQPVTFITPNNSKQVSIPVAVQRDLVQPLFKPYQSYMNIFPHGNAVANDAPGIGALIFQCLKNLSANDSLYRDLLSNVVIQGGMSYIPGLEDGILNDLRLYVKDYQISSYLNNDDAERAGESWLGGCLSTQWADAPITVQEWSEMGGNLIKSRHL